VPAVAPPAGLAFVLVGLVALPGCGSSSGGVADGGSWLDGSMAFSGTALVDVLDFSDAGCCNTSVGTSISGTVTLTTVIPGHVAGNFQVLLAPIDGGVNASSTSSAAPFSGHFDTTACPGTTQ